MLGDNDSWTGPDEPATIGDPPKCLDCGTYYNRSVILPSCKCRPTDAERIAALEAEVAEANQRAELSEEIANDVVGDAALLGKYLDDCEGEGLGKRVLRAYQQALAAQPTVEQVCEAVDESILVTGEQYDEYDTGADCAKQSAIKAIRDAFAATKTEAPPGAIRTESIDTAMKTNPWDEEQTT